ncbi:UDP-glucose:glycoprotein glucosyltransferase [Condylostylus longicornis]|uniref:UDP-glucose:glycoprotein glucosyltransferase n=1 Tax=Condylostylus longicornis TaxID=2530218 RepID=UPI00244E3DEE|nr:UDP-glucose:glycoprotein glucosyltransferase [Condylostylus longicornis]
MLGLLFLVFLINSSNFDVYSLKTFPITTLINAKWKQTPIYLEIAEYLSDENPSYYWDFVERLGDLETSLANIDTDSKSYIMAMGIANNILGPMHSTLLKLAISMHSLTPRIQTHLQIANESLNVRNCDNNIFSTVRGVVCCSFEELKSKLNNNVPNSDNEETYSFDHIYSGSDKNALSVVLYGDIGSDEFHEYHKFLKQKAIEGQIKYISRHYVKINNNKPVRLSGFGVELHLKSTEYKSQDDSPRTPEENVKFDEATETVVDGFDFETLKSRFPDLENSLNRLRSNLLEKNEDLAPLKAWEFQDLGLQAAQRVAEIQGEESLQILQLTAQNFPTQAKSLSVQSVSQGLRKEIKHNIEVFGRSLNIQPPDAALFVNGLYFDVDTLDLSSLVETLRSELRVIDNLYKNNVSGKLAAKLLALDLSGSSNKEFAIDIRDSAILWINDIENDPQYRRWPSSVTDLLRPTFPGMLRNIRKNVFNLVLIIDPLKIDSRNLVKLAESFVIHSAPVRLGLVFDDRKSDSTNDDSYRAMFCAFNYITQNKDARAAISFLTDIYASIQKDKDVTYKEIKLQLKKLFNSLSLDDIEEILSEDSEYDYGRKLHKDFVQRINFRSTPQALINGVPVQESFLNVDDFEEAIFTEVMQQTPILQKAVYKGDLSDNDVLIDYLMNQPHVMPRLNQRILGSENVSFLDLSGVAHDINHINTLAKLSNRDMTATLMKNLKYFTGKPSTKSSPFKDVHFMTVWVFADLNTGEGKELLLNALKYMTSVRNIRVAFIPNAEGEISYKIKNLNHLVWAASQALDGEIATSFAIRLLENQVSDSADVIVPEAVKEILPSTDVHIKMLRFYAQRAINLSSAQRMVIVNGKMYGPLLEDESFETDDFALIERCNNLQYIDKLKRVFIASEEELQLDSDVVLKLFSSLTPRQSKSRFTLPSDLQEAHSVVKLEPKKPDEPYFEIAAVLDPASRAAQKIASHLILLRNVINCNMKVYLCAIEQHSDMPVKNFYRYVVEPEVKFSQDGKLADGPEARFTSIPANPLLTQNMQVPENWLIEPVRSVYDLDNIKLVDIGGPVHSEFELEYLLLEGHCFDSNTGAPPRGLQMTLGTKSNPLMVDTIVMANLGYFQLKANPGIWELRLREGKSADIYDINSAEGTNTIYQNISTKIVISSLRSHVIKLKVSKKPEMTNVDLLSDDEESGSIWNSITSSFGGGKEASGTETINIFSVASGHLYERLLRIMMLSLLKHTKSPVKFWFLKNYLSPHFIDFLPHMAKNYNFEYELVQYKWPRWLHQQTEKQRTIWGYKILFLDVLFPLDVKKIIFVDADAIVRTDIKELNELPLNGAPYAYTPFCDSRKEMEGFRFWKQGYWKSHLMGRRYHISALYVVDLKKFRRIAAGDRLRGQYQALSPDPNSLSNLDQDLPNNMIHQVAIKSLPEEWLWCQTWCSDSSFKKAKVIDLCNNPQTKEAKLTAAQRIVPEWKDYDLEIKNLIAKVEDTEMENQDAYSGQNKINENGGDEHTEFEVNDDLRHSEL